MTPCLQCKRGSYTTREAPATTIVIEIQSGKANRRKNKQKNNELGGNAAKTKTVKHADITGTVYDTCICGHAENARQDEWPASRSRRGVNNNGSTRHEMTSVGARCSCWWTDGWSGR